MVTIKVDRSWKAYFYQALLLWGAGVLGYIALIVFAVPPDGWLPTLSAVVILAATFSLCPVRRGGAAVMIVSGLGTGFLLYFLSDVVYALGVSSKLPVVIAAWSPALIASFLGVSVLLHVEDG